MHPEFTPQGVTLQTSPIEQQSPIRTQNNLLSQNSIPAPEATVPDTPEEKIPKSLNGEGVKNSKKQATTSTTNTQDSRLCFRCKQLGHLKKDCPELPYCSKCRTQGHIQAKCPTKQQDNRRQDKRCKSTNKRCETQREDWKKTQDRLQFSNRTNKCLNCTGNHGTQDSPTRQQPHAPRVSNPANDTGIYKNSSQSQNHSPQQHSQQSASTMSISTPTLLVNNPLQTGPQQGQQQQHPPPQIPPPNQPANSPIRHNQFNQQFQQPQCHKLAHLWHHHNSITLKFHHHISIITHPKIIHQWTVMNHCLQEYFTGKWTWQKDKKSMTRRENKEKNAKRNVISAKREKQTRGHASTRLLKR